MRERSFPIILLLALLAIFNFTMLILTFIEGFREQAVAGISIRFGMAILSLLLIFGIMKRRPWAFYVGITFASFGIINSIWSIIISIRLELPIMFGITMLMLFAATLYYLIIKRQIFIK